MKFKYLDTVYIVASFSFFYNKDQAWLIKAFNQDLTGEPRYLLYPKGVGHELAPEEEIWQYESNLETMMERNIRELREQQQQRQHAIKTQEEFYLDVLRKQELQAKIMSMKELISWPDVQPGVIVTPKEEVLTPEYSYEPIFKEDKE